MELNADHVREIINNYKAAGCMMNEIINKGYADLLSLDLSLEDEDLRVYDDESPVRSIMKISILVDHANELAQFLPLAWKRLIAAITVNLFPLDTVSIIVSYVECPLLQPYELGEFSRFFERIVHQMENSTI